MSFLITWTVLKNLWLLKNKSGRKYCSWKLRGGNKDVRAFLKIKGLFKSWGEGNKGVRAFLKIKRLFIAFSDSRSNAK